METTEVLPGARCGSDMALLLRIWNAWNDLFPLKYSTCSQTQQSNAPGPIHLCRHQQEALLSFVIPVKMLVFNIQVAEPDKNAAGMSLLVVIY